MKSKRNFTLTLGAIGVVFGDIGTSPIYALRECLAPGRGVELTPGPILGVTSLLLWTLFLVVCVKYLALVLRADNRGEGGILALVSLLKSHWAVLAGIVGAALLYADGVLTPAISVLSALEGLNLVSASFEPWIVPTALAVLVALFAFQSRGTGRVSAFFGPVIVLWFVVIGALGLASVIREPYVLVALNPLTAVQFGAANPLLTFTLLGYVFLAVTGAEALYADLGHFGKGPIRSGWYALAFPALVLNYLGQAALLLADPSKTGDLFFQLAPVWLVIPLVVLSTLATVIASQAVITGAFSLARQSIQLGLWPRMTVRHTSSETIGQVYVPLVNGLLFVGTAALVLGFRESSKLADAYGIAVSGTMVLTTLLMVAAARRLWSVPWVALIPLALFFLLFDGTFFAANATKLFSGGWIVLATALVLFVIMKTWQDGRKILFRKVQTRFLSLTDFVASLTASSSPLKRIPRAAVFLSGNPRGVPLCLLHNLKHNQVLHEPTLLVTVVTEEIPKVLDEERAEVTAVGMGISQIVLRYGFSELPDVPVALEAIPGIGFEAGRVTYFLGKEALVVKGAVKGLSVWRQNLFSFLVHNAQEATAFYRLPPGQVVELGGRTEL
jgi:KUP system potassium uptake protein